jgi:hypothetical protein
MTGGSVAWAKGLVKEWEAYFSNLKPVSVAALGIPTSMLIDYVNHELNIGLWGLLGYPLSGIHREIEQSYGANRVDYVVRSRIRQGIAEWNATLPEERAAVLDKWSALDKTGRH